MADGLALLVHSGAFDRVHYALAMAAAAAATDRPVLLFFSGSAVRALKPKGWTELDVPGGAVARDASLLATGVGGFTTLLEACRDLGVTIAVCEMALAVEAIEPAWLRADLGVEIFGLISFYERAEGLRLIFI